MKKSERLEIRLTGDQKKQLLELAKFYDISMAELILELVGRAYMDYLGLPASIDDNSCIYIY